MNSFLIVFSVIVLANAKPTDYNEPQYDDISTSVSGESDENSSLIATNPSGVFTKYPDDPFDSYSVPIVYDSPPEETRIRRETDLNATDTSIDVLSKQTDQIEDVKRPERKTEEQTKVPLRGFISAIESDLVSKALQVNSQLNQRRRRRRSFDHEDDNEGDDDEDSKESVNNKSDNSTVQSDSLDVNKNFFEGLFNYTRPERESEDKDVKIPLNGLVQAVETTLVNSAQNLKDSKPSKRDVFNSTKDTSKSNTDNSNESHQNDAEIKQQPDIKVAKIKSSVELNLLGPIAFKPAPTATEESTHSDEETISTTEIPIQKTNLSVIKESHSLSLVPGADKKVTHVQTQQILQTVFSSNLAIFPTIPPESINAPLPTHIPTTEEPDQTTITPKVPTNTKTEQELKHEQLMQKAQQLKEKFAEIQAEPVILSHF
ncbi:uncharacterized protein LOC116345751 [Contarinia nasturtii]|uniref:uncharacterized protein LOC116345751 n=1 Tax=Contarinia nasturtii TaxID=265458 RepID=UPI0012D3EF19|nr:uncharacterized protein LOC116345751 [Contarinia nasturtii]